MHSQTFGANHESVNASFIAQITVGRFTFRVRVELLETYAPYHSLAVCRLLVAVTSRPADMINHDISQCQAQNRATLCENRTV
jgi:hypothetical protein